MTDVENTDLLLQYMRIVVRQQDGILEALNSMQRQNDNLSAILAQELGRRNDNSSRGTTLKIVLELTDLELVLFLPRPTYHKLEKEETCTTTKNSYSS